jgi:PTS system mannose-specific IIA component
MAFSVIESAEMIMGAMSSVYGISLDPGDSPENLEEKLNEIVQSTEQSKGILILVDLPGATPFNVSANFAHESANVAVVSGLNLPMLIEVALQNQGISLQELEKIAKNSGMAGIKTFSELMDG